MKSLDLSFRTTLGRFLFPALTGACAVPIVSAPFALLVGMTYALLLGNPHLNSTRKMTSRLLQMSVIGLGAGMNLTVIGQVGFEGMGYTVASISVTLFLGIVLGRLFKVEESTSLLLTVGTAICGGSAIAAVAPVIRAKPHEISIALATVFFLNSAALLLFPELGHFFSLSETQFGLWSALAIHDTSSVVGAALKYGPHALDVATTVKLARALWIVPVAASIGFFWNRKSAEPTQVAAKRPWFILGFLVAAALVTWVPALQSPGQWVSWGAKRCLVVTLFLIGSGLTRSTLKSVGIRPLIQGSVLWFFAGSVTLGAILEGWIR